MALGHRLRRHGFDPPRGPLGYPARRGRCALSVVGILLPALGVLASLVWLWLLVGALRYDRRGVMLAERPDGEPDSGWPGLTVVLAARNEAAEVEDAVRSLVRQDYPGLRVVAVDDRSTDGTGEILDSIAAESRCLQVVHIGALPPGWLGKTHALHVGSRATAADWLLFTDGDVKFEPGALRRSLRYAVDRGIDHLTVIPGMPMEGFGEKLFLTIFGFLFFLKAPPWRVENPRSPAHLGAGAFNLVRRSAFDAVGGFERLALSVDDDIRLGQILKMTGHRPGALLGSGAVSVRWHVGLRGLISGVEKNFFGGLDFRPERALGAVVVVLWLAAAPFVGLLAGPWWTRAICALALSGVLFILGTLGGELRIGWYYGLLLPVSAVLIVYALLRSMAKTYRSGGIRWRDHHYPLPELRTHVRERNAWMRNAWRETRRRSRDEWTPG